MLNEDSTLKSWIVTYATVAVIAGLPLYFGFFHLVLAIPIPQLLLPFVLHAVATMLIAPAFYQARRRQVLTSGADLRLYFWSIAIYCLVVLFCWTFFGARSGAIPRRYETQFYVLSALVSVLGSAASYFVNKLVFPKRGKTNVAD